MVPSVPGRRGRPATGRCVIRIEHSRREAARRPRRPSRLTLILRGSSTSVKWIPVLLAPMRCGRRVGFAPSELHRGEVWPLRGTLAAPWGRMALTAVGDLTLLLVASSAGLIGALGGVGGGLLVVPALTLRFGATFGWQPAPASSPSSRRVRRRRRLRPRRPGQHPDRHVPRVGDDDGAVVGRSSPACDVRTLFLVLGLMLSLRRHAVVAPGEEVRPRVTTSRKRCIALRLRGGSTTRRPCEPRRLCRCRRVAYSASPLMWVAGVVSGLLGIGSGALKVSPWTGRWACR